MAGVDEKSFKNWEQKKEKKKLKSEYKVKKQRGKTTRFQPWRENDRFQNGSHC